MTTLYGPLNGNVVERADYVPDDFYSHPAIQNMDAARRKLELIQTLTDEVIGAIPETPTKGAAVMHLHTASMWLDKALNQGYIALRKAYSQMEEQKKRLEEQAAHNARAGDERAYSSSEVNQAQDIQQAATSSSRKANRA